MNITRREWMLAAACWGEVLRAQSAGAEKFIWFDPASAGEIRAIAAQIIPDDATPGAERAGVIFFIDRALAGYDQDKQDLYKRGLAETEAKREEMFPGSASVASLKPEQQIALLNAIEKGAFFQQVRLHTILGFFGNPAHGGNRDMVGWKLIGIEHQMHWEPPFGYYDAEAARGGTK